MAKSSQVPIKLTADTSNLREGLTRAHRAFAYAHARQAIAAYLMAHRVPLEEAHGAAIDVLDVGLASLIDEWSE